MLNYQAVKNWDFGSIVQTYTERDSMLYALGIGMNWVERPARRVPDAS
jgi:hypothetical protein